MSQEKLINSTGKLNRNHKDIKKLMDLGVQRGFLSYIEVHELLPPEMVSPEELDASVRKTKRKKTKTLYSKIFPAAKKPKKNFKQMNRAISYRLPNTQRVLTLLNYT
jgi:hypothetical protein